MSPKNRDSPIAFFLFSFFPRTLTDSFSLVVNYFFMRILISTRFPLGSIQLYVHFKTQTIKDFLPKLLQVTGCPLRQVRLLDGALRTNKPPNKLQYNTTQCFPQNDSNDGGIYFIFYLKMF